MITGGNRNIAGWLSEFVSHLANNKNENISKEAEININDLPKVVWNDETFYVMFENETATVINEFGNVVTTLQGVTTIESVDEYLNSKQVVTSEKEEDNSDKIFEEELKKVSSYLDIKNAEEINSIPMTNTTPNPEVSSHEDNGTQDVGFDNKPIDNNENNPEGDPMVTNAEVESIEGELYELKESKTNEEIINKIANLENAISNLAKRVEALNEQEYAHVDHLEEVDNGAAKRENEHFQETSKNSEEKINLEHEVDITTPVGRISLIDKLREQINPLLEDINIEDGQEYGHTELEIPENKDDYFNEVHYVDEEIDEDNIKLEVEETDDPNVLTVNRDDIDLDDTLVEDNVIKVENNEENIDVELKEEKEEDEEEKEEVIKLSNKDSKIFKHAVCPSCGDELIKTKVAGLLQGIKCKGECKSEYAVNLETGNIFKKNI